MVNYRKEKQMKNKLGIKVDDLGIKVCCENCCGCAYRDSDLSAKCTESGGFAFEPNRQALITRLRYLQKLMREEIDAVEEGVSALRTYYEERIKELHEQQFTKEEAEKVETFLMCERQMNVNEDKEIFSKLKKMKGK